MRNNIFSFILILLVLIAVSGCGSFWRGAAVGAAGVGVADAIVAKNQIDKLNEDYKAGNITKEQYDIRLDQIKKGSLIY